MKKAIIAILLALPTLLPCVAQEREKAPKRERKFSHEQFQAKQREYITAKAALTPEEAAAFFPIFFELQKEKFRIEREARGTVIKERGQKLTPEECKELLSHTADAKIKIAQLEKEYIAKYLNIVSPQKLLDIQRAEHSFQGYMIKTMSRGNKHPHKRHEGKKD